MEKIEPIRNFIIAIFVLFNYVLLGLALNRLVNHFANKKTKKKSCFKVLKIIGIVALVLITIKIVGKIDLNQSLDKNLLETKYCDWWCRWSDSVYVCEGEYSHFAFVYHISELLTQTIITMILLLCIRFKEFNKTTKRNIIIVVILLIVLALVNMYLINIYSDLREARLLDIINKTLL